MDLVPKQQRSKETKEDEEEMTTMVLSEHGDDRAFGHGGGGGGRRSEIKEVDFFSTTAGGAAARGRTDGHGGGDGGAPGRRGCDNTTVNVSLLSCPDRQHHIELELRLIDACAYYLRVIKVDIKSQMHTYYICLCVP